MNPDDSLVDLVSAMPGSVQPLPHASVQSCPSCSDQDYPLLLNQKRNKTIHYHDDKMCPFSAL